MSTFDITAAHISEGTLTSEAIKAIQESGPVSIRAYPFAPLTKWPEALTEIKGNLDLRETDIESLPRGMEVDGNLDLCSSKIERLPEGLKVGGYLNLWSSKIECLPEGLKVNGDLNLRGCPIESLPEDLEVGGYLDLSGSQIKSLPENLKVNGDLVLSHSQIERLPRGLEVNGDLVLWDTGIKSLPEGLRVGGNIDLRFCNELIVTKKLAEYIQEQDNTGRREDWKKPTRKIFWPKHLDTEDDRYNAYINSPHEGVRGWNLDDFAQQEALAQGSSSSPSGPAESYKRKAVGELNGTPPKKRIKTEAESTEKEREGSPAEKAHSKPSWTETVSRSANLYCIML
ncbi:MAG: hypothetical protein KUG67_02720 [Proteobacteria bacterium]|nr:hypothetical protein [Pseudomonadota bacterium]